MKVIPCLFLLFFYVKGYSQNSLGALQNNTEFIKLSGKPLSDKYGQVKSVKVVYDIKGKRLYFTNSKRYTYHYEFCTNEISVEGDIVHFNMLNYGLDPERDYLLANINYYQSFDKYVLEISSIDMMSESFIIQLYQLVSASAFFGDRLYFLLNSPRLQRNRNLLSEIKVIDPAEVYAHLNFQAIGKFENEGVLKFMSDFNLGKNDIHPTDIIVIDTTPQYLPNVAGIIITEFQTPLSHLTILGQNRKIPICAYKAAFSDSALRMYANQMVHFSVTADTFKLARIEGLQRTKRKQKPIKLEFDLSADSLIDVKYFNQSSSGYIGNKASNFGILYNLSKTAEFRVPEAAFAIPFYFYNAHAEKSGAKSMVSTLLKECDVLANKDSLKSYLKKIRKAIQDTPLDTVLLRSVENKITQGFFNQMRFRSSTNAEDARGFSGAGLYRSKTGILNSIEKPIDEAIKDVWASLWSYEAFTERQYYHIKQEDVYMGILVHRGFPSEEVNGVAITKNPYRDGNDGFLINVQLGDESVVKPSDGNICDQLICYPKGVNEQFDNDNAIEIITLSNLNGGELIMTDIEIQHLADQLELIKTYFLNNIYHNYMYLELGLDVEFKLDGESRQLYIKQVRVYNN